MWCDEAATAVIGKDQAVVNWLLDLARYVRQVDPVHHPVGTNLHAMDNVSDPCFQAIQGSDAIDWIAIHSYGLHFPDQARHPWMVRSGKPILSTESYNLADDLAGARRRTWQGMALFSTELEWSSGFLPDRPDWDQDLRHHFDEMLAILRAASDVARQTIEADSWGDPAPAGIGNAVATTDGRRLMAYFQQADPAVPFGMPELPAGRYQVQWFDCASIERLSQSIIDWSVASTLHPPAGEVFLYVRPDQDRAVCCGG